MPAVQNFRPPVDEVTVTRRSFNAGTGWVTQTLGVWERDDLVDRLDNELHRVRLTASAEARREIAEAMVRAMLRGS